MASQASASRVQSGWPQSGNTAAAPPEKMTFPLSQVPPVQQALCDQVHRDSPPQESGFAICGCAWLWHVVSGFSLCGLWSQPGVEKPPGGHGPTHPSPSQALPQYQLFLMFLTERMWLYLMLLPSPLLGAIGPKLNCPPHSPQGCRLGSYS